MKDTDVDLMAKYRVSGARLRAELKRLEEARIRAIKRYFDRLERELEVELIDSRRDW